MTLTRLAVSPIARLATILALAGLFLAGGLGLRSVAGQSTLVVGNIQILGVNPDTNSISFVTWTEMEPGTSIIFADGAWNQTINDFSVFEGGVIWQSDATEPTPIGTVVVIDGAIADSGTITAGAGLDLTTNDNVFALQNDGNIRFLYGLNYGVDTWADISETPTAARSHLPDQLVNNFVTASFDASEFTTNPFLEYGTPRQQLGSLGRYRLLVLNSVYYETYAAAGPALSSTDFSVGANSPPSILITAGGFAIPSGGVVFGVLADDISDLQLLITVQDINLDRVQVATSITNLQAGYGVDLGEWSAEQSEVPYVLLPQSGRLLRTNINHLVTITATDEFGGEQTVSFTIQVGDPSSSSSDGGCAMDPMADDGGGAWWIGLLALLAMAGYRRWTAS